MSYCQKSYSMCITALERDVIKVAAAACEAAYESKSGAIPSDCTAVEKTAEYVVWEMKAARTLVIAFPGILWSNLWEMYYSSLNVIKGKMGLGKGGESSSVVSGFKKRCDEHANLVKKYAQKCIEEDLSLCVGGHSLGATEAVVLVMKLLEEDANVQKLFEQNRLSNVNFGSPQMGTDKMARYVKKKGWDSIMINVVDPADLICYGSYWLHKYGMPTYKYLCLDTILKAALFPRENENNDTADIKVHFGNFFIVYPKEKKEGTDDDEHEHEEKERFGFEIILAEEASKTEKKMNDRCESADREHHNMGRYHKILLTILDALQKDLKASQKKREEEEAAQQQKLEDEKAEQKRKEEEEAAAAAAAAEVERKKLEEQKAEQDKKNNETKKPKKKSDDEKAEQKKKEKEERESQKRTEPAAAVEKPAEENKPSQTSAASAKSKTNAKRCC